MGEKILQGIRVPKLIGHKYIPIEILPLDKLQTTFLHHRRLKVFANKGCKCVICPKEGIYLIKAKAKHGGFHTDLYTKNFELMTVDHILPKSKGGSMDLSNLDPMCEKCNTKKGNKYSSNIEYLACRFPTQIESNGGVHT